MSSSTERNQEDVDLVTETLKLLDEIDASTANRVTDMRSLLVNLCDTQARFATPMAMPFGGTAGATGDDDDDEDDDAPVFDMKSRLATPRPLSLLLKYRVVYKCPPECLVEELVDCERSADEPDAVFVFVGGDSWEAMVKRGLLTGDDAKPPADSVWLWLPELFKLLAAVADKHPNARRLAGAWYYTATEVDLSNDDDDDDEDDVEDETEKAAAPAVVGDGDDDDDEDDDDDDDEGEEFVPEDEGEDEEIDDDGDEDEDEDAWVRSVTWQMRWRAADAKMRSKRSVAS
jgi:hypothetical protein